MQHLDLSMRGLQRRAWKASAGENTKPISASRDIIKGFIPFGVAIADREILAPGCFSRCLAGDGDIAVLWESNVEKILGRRSAETARFREDADGLHYEADLPDTQFARDLKTLVQRGDVRESSAAFYVTKKHNDEKSGLRIIDEALLVAVGPVVFSAFTDAVVDVEEAIAAARLAGWKLGRAARGGRP
jgi:HK97 family phage prohead protease